MENQQDPQAKSSSLRFNPLLLFAGALLLLILGFVGGFTLRVSKIDYENTGNLAQVPIVSHAPIATETSSPSSLEEPDKDLKCSKEECLIKSGNEYFGLGVLKGYYKKYDGTKWEWGNQQVFCDGFVLTDGSEKLINQERKAVEYGNTLNKIIDNNLIINLELSGLSQNEKQLILKSGPTTPINLYVVTKRDAMEGRGVSTCFSTVDIVSVATTIN